VRCQKDGVLSIDLFLKSQSDFSLEKRIKGSSDPKRVSENSDTHKPHTHIWMDRILPRCHTGEEEEEEEEAQS
jgi:hypothetical protein